MYRRIVLVLLSAFVGTCLAAQDILVATKTGDEIEILDRTDGSVLSSTTLTLAGATISGVKGLSVDPTTGEIYAVVKSASGRELCTVDRFTGVCTSIGVFTDYVASIAFDGAGNLYAVTGDGAANPATFFSVSLTTAALSYLVQLHSSGRGEAIAFNPDDGLMYHLSGETIPVEFSTIDLSTNAVTAIANSFPGGFECTAFYYDSSGTFLAVGHANEFKTISTSGQIGSSPMQIAYIAKGVVILPSVSPSTMNLTLRATIVGEPGKATSLDLSGAHLVGDVTITAPAGVEVSSTITGGYGSTLNLSQSNGTLTSQFFVRIQSGAPVGAVSGNLSITPAGGDTVQVAVSGQVVSPGKNHSSGCAASTGHRPDVLALVVLLSLVAVSVRCATTRAGALR